MDHAYLVYALETGRDGTIHPLSEPSSPGSTSIYIYINVPVPRESHRRLNQRELRRHLFVQLSLIWCLRPQHILEFLGNVACLYPTAQFAFASSCLPGIIVQVFRVSPGGVTPEVKRRNYYDQGIISFSSPALPASPLYPWVVSTFTSKAIRCNSI